VRRLLSLRIAGGTLGGAVVTLVLGTAMAGACRREQVLARQGDLIITGAYAHPSAGDAGAAYVRFRNAGSAPDTLIGMSGPEPATAMLMGTAGGRMEMLPPLVINQGEQVVMQPGGIHVMLGGLTPEYKIGDTLRLTLTFARAGQIRIAAPVVPFGEMPE
jgi:copper(I)-binding protein